MFRLFRRPKPPSPFLSHAEIVSTVKLNIGWFNQLDRCEQAWADRWIASEVARVMGRPATKQSIDDLYGMAARSLVNAE